MARVLADKLRLVRLGRRVGVLKAARQLGVATTVVQQLEAGAYPFNDALIKRIYNWMYLGIDYTDFPFKERKRDQTGETPVTVYLVSDLAKQLTTEAYRLGLTQEGLARLFVERGMKTAGLVTIQDAMDELERARTLEVMKRPELFDTLRGEVSVAVQAGDKLTPVKEYAKTFSVAEQLIDFEPLED